ncbi:hypothetical protein CCR75_005693 [Bremia lactucae]|uniref:Uncharacterized protein n=1 Tax=Bremia lactucae TaxID=4779 RepID=A0A976FEV5_BRELC|nr:hypothetical protein CCR75_005693 [Bremia lactucae]
MMPSRSSGLTKARAEILSTLRDHFRDEPLARLICQSKVSKSAVTRRNARQLDRAQLDTWQLHNLDEIVVYTMLKLNPGAPTDIGFFQ